MIAGIEIGKADDPRVSRQANILLDKKARKGRVPKKIKVHGQKCDVLGHVSHSEPLVELDAVVDMDVTGGDTDVS